MFLRKPEIVRAFAPALAVGASIACFSGCKGSSTDPGEGGSAAK
jgi:hypothetical protein